MTRCGRACQRTLLPVKLASAPHRAGCRVLLGLTLFLSLALGIAHANPPRVLIIHSFGGAAPPFTTHSIAFETELTEKMGQQVDLDEVSLDMARYADRDMQEALVDYIKKRQATWQPDLVVPIGSPAGIFVAQFRDQLFPETPVIYTGMDGRRLPAGALQKNATFVGEDFNLPDFVKDMLQVAPATTNIVVVIGASPLEQFWTTAFRQAFAPFTNRVSFTWLNDLSFDQMLDHVSKLPARSYIFIPLLLRDATGVTHNADEALKRIHAVANAPINSLYQHQLGLGIVGGRLYQAELEGIEAAHIAIRILHGESATTISPKIVGPLPPRYDWRELQRWGISEASLPKGSSILFREPSFWELYRWPIIVILCFCILETALIIGLLANRAKRREEENKVRQLSFAVEQSPVLVVMTDLQGRITYVNRTFTEVTGYSLAECLGQNPRILKSGELPAAVYKELWATITRGGTWRGEFHNRKKNGDLYWEGAAISPLLDATGHITHFVGIKADITERKHAELLLRASEELNRATFEQAAVGITHVGLDGRWLQANDKFCSIVGYQRDELMQLHFQEIVHPDDLEKELPLRRRMLAGELKSYFLEKRYRRKDNSTAWVAITVSLLRLEDGTPLHFIAMVEDITEHKRAEAELLRQRAELAHVSRVSTMGELAASVAHELNQPLGAILANAEAAELFLQHNPPALSELRATLADIRKDDERASEVIRRMRALLRKHELDLQPIEINSLVEEVLQLVSGEAALRQVVLAADLQPFRPKISGDRVHLQQVLLNLILNGMDAMNGQPTGRRQISVRSRVDDDGLVELAVEDSGHGIEPDKMPRLFEPFYTTKPNGMGMGLSIARTIIKAHNGRIWAENNPAGGSIFRIMLPSDSNRQSDGKIK